MMRDFVRLHQGCGGEIHRRASCRPHVLLDTQHAGFVPPSSAAVFSGLITWTSLLPITVVAFLGDDGTLPLMSLATRQLVGTLKMNGSVSGVPG